MLTTTAAAAGGGESNGWAREAHCLRLPGTLLARVLLHVPQQQRLQHAAPVCSSFATAAAAATVSVDIDSLQTKQLPAFQAWIDRHAQQLVSISVKTPDWDADQPWLSALQLRLPAAGLQQLCSLDLAGVEVLLPERTEANSSSSGNTSTSTNKSLRLPKLQDLRLDSCVVRVATVRQLGQLSGLTRLQLRSLSQDRVMLQVLELRPFGSLQHQLDITTAVRQILQRSPQLARLELACWNMLYVTASKMLSGFAAHFPSSLTALRVGDLDVGMEAPDLTGSISALTSLRELAAARVSVCPSALTSLTQLRDLQLHYFTFPPPESDNPAGAADGGSASALLSALSGMLQLQRLSVINEQNALAGANASQFSALTASSQLTHLQVTAREQQPLPSAALQHMFPGGKQLPLLQHVALSTYGPGAEPGNLTVAVTAEELSSMFSACPGLCSLNITGFLYPDTAYDALLELPSTCCSLCIGGEDLDDEAAGVIAQLTHLTCLDWTNSPDLTDAGVECLTALQELQSLCLSRNYGLSAGLLQGRAGVYLKVSEPDAGAQPISQQLHELLESVPGAVPWMQRLYGEQERFGAAMEAHHDAQEEERQFMDHALHVIRCCAGHSAALPATLDLIDIGRKALSGNTAAADGEDLEETFKVLQQSVLNLCSSKQLPDSDACYAALDCMGAAVCRRLRGESGVLLGPE